MFEGRQTDWRVNFLPAANFSKVNYIYCSSNARRTDCGSCTDNRHNNNHRKNY